MENLKVNYQFDTIFTDINKAFDTVDNGLLIDALDNLSIGNLLLYWLSFYLISRRQCVSINDLLSDISIITSGNFQSGHLSPLLFIIFMNSFNDYLSFSKIIILFANLHYKLHHKINSSSD